MALLQQQSQPLAYTDVCGKHLIPSVHFPAFTIKFSKALPVDAYRYLSELCRFGLKAEKQCSAVTELNPSCQDWVSSSHTALKRCNVWVDYWCQAVLKQFLSGGVDFASLFFGVLKLVNETGSLTSFHQFFCILLYVTAETQECISPALIHGEACLSAPSWVALKYCALFFKT